MQIGSILLTSLICILTDISIIVTLLTFQAFKIEHHCHLVNISNSLGSSLPEHQPLALFQVLGVLDKPEENHFVKVLDKPGR